MMGLLDLIYGFRTRARLRAELARLQPDLDARMRYMRGVTVFMPEVETTVMQDLPDAVMADDLPAWGARALPILERALGSIAATSPPDDATALVREGMLAALGDYADAARCWIEGDDVAGRALAQSGREHWETAIDDLQGLAD